MSRDLTQYPVMTPTFEVTAASGATPTVATISMEPLEQGYGHTVGNALRRVLLSSLPGTAITEVHIEGVDHLYSTLDGMKEDVLELVLNLKLVRVHADTETDGTIRLQAKGPGVVTASSIECDAGFSIINPDQHIATLEKGSNLDITMTVSSGVGYAVVGDEKSTQVGQIKVDALYSPVEKVSYRVEATRVGRRTDYDKLVLEIQTDGTIEPLEAVRQAAQILQRQFSQIVNPVVPAAVEPEVSLSPEEAEVLRLTVEELDLPTRIANALRKGGFKTVGDLVTTSRSVVSKVKNLGGKSVEVIDEALQKKGVSLSE
ncbi:MAG: DNA-directed RNA polymerase subunit alpha [Microgenomates group bacterium]